MTQPNIFILVLTVIVVPALSCCSREEYFSKEKELPFGSPNIKTSLPPDYIPKFGISGIPNHPTGAARIRLHANDNWIFVVDSAIKENAWFLGCTEDLWYYHGAEKGCNWWYSKYYRHWLCCETWKLKSYENKWLPVYFGNNPWRYSTGDGRVYLNKENKNSHLSKFLLSFFGSP